MSFPKHPEVLDLADLEQVSAAAKKISSSVGKGGHMASLSPDRRPAFRLVRAGD